MVDARPHAFLDALAPADRQALLARARTIRTRKGQTVMAKGESSGEVFIVQEGRLEVLLYAANGREISLRGLQAGQMFGELAAIDGETRSASIMAVTDGRLLAIGRQAFRAVVSQSPEATDWLLRRLTTQIRSLTNRVFEMSALHVQARLHCELMRLARAHGGADAVIDPAPTHAELASRIGTHREAITRELSELARRKIIRGGRRRLEFLDLDRLEDELRANLMAPVAEEGGW
ncbi:MAG TPA: Crp/Fnr family transcriptional regulator [Allosphingosinicella sp.]